MRYLINLVITMILGIIISILFFKKFDKDWRNMDVDYMAAILIGAIISGMTYFIINLNLN